MASAVEVAPAAFANAWAHSLSEIPKRFPDMEKYVNEMLISQSPISQDLRSACQLLLSLQDDKHSDSMQSYLTKLQKRLGDKIRKLKSDRNLQGLMTSNAHEEAAKFQSVQEKGVGSWIEAIPASNKFALGPNKFHVAVCLRLGLSLKFPCWLDQCECGRPVDNNGYHLMTCKFSGGPVWSHKCVADGWSELLRELGIHHKREPRSQYVCSDNRPDIIMFDSDLGQNTKLDTSLTHPWNKAVLMKTSKEEGAAASKREDEKMAKYAAKQLPGGGWPNCIPLVLEHFGYWGKEAEAFLKNLSKRARISEWSRHFKDFVNYWQKQMAVILQKCNVSVILNHLKERREADPDEDGTVQYFVH